MFSDKLLTLTELEAQFNLAPGWLQTQINAGLLVAHGGSAFEGDVKKLLDEIQQAERNDYAAKQAEERNRVGSLQYFQARQQKLRQAGKMRMVLSRSTEPVFDGGENDPQIILMRKYNNQSK